MGHNGKRVLIKGAGDLATGIGWRLKRCGFSVLMTELEQPTTVRRTVAFSNGVYDGAAQVEGIRAVLAKNISQVEEIIKKGDISIVIDPKADIIREFKPDILVDAILAKRNTGTKKEDAALVIGTGPGFTAGQDCHYVIETKRGHSLGKVIEQGSAIPNTGIPGEIGGYTTERLIKALAAGIFKPRKSIGQEVAKGQIVGESGGVPIEAQMSGMVRGMLKEGIFVKPGMKCGDIDARCRREHCFTISDKARAIGGGVLEAILFSQGN